MKTDFQRNGQYPRFDHSLEFSETKPENSRQKKLLPQLLTHLSELLPRNLPFRVQFFQDIHRGLSLSDHLLPARLPEDDIGGQDDDADPRDDDQDPPQEAVHTREFVSL